MEVVGQVDGDQNAGWRGVDAHVVGGVVEELGPGVSLYIVRVVVSPSQLNVQPILLGRGVVHRVPANSRFRKARMFIGAKKACSVTTIWAMTIPNSAGHR